MKGNGSIFGKTLRFHFADGPMKGKDYDHIFRANGKVDWGAAGGKDKTQSDGSLVDVGDNVYVGSYMSDQGYTLTSAINLDTGKLVSFASNGKAWSQHEGTVEVVN